MFIRVIRPSPSQPNVNHAIAMSSDTGASWEAAEAVDSISGPNCQGSIMHLDATTASSSSSSSPNFNMFTTVASSPHGRANMTVYTPITSKPGAWQPVLSLWGGPAAYSSAVQLQDGVLGVLYERGNYHPYESLYLVCSLQYVAVLLSMRG